MASQTPDFFIHILIFMWYFRVTLYESVLGMIFLSLWTVKVMYDRNTLKLIDTYYQILCYWICWTVEIFCYETCLLLRVQWPQPLFFPCGFSLTFFAWCIFSLSSLRILLFLSRKEDSATILIACLVACCLNETWYTVQHTMFRPRVSWSMNIKLFFLLLLLLFTLLLLWVRYCYCYNRYIPIKLLPRMIQSYCFDFF